MALSLRHSRMKYYITNPYCRNYLFEFTPCLNEFLWKRVAVGDEGLSLFM